MWCIYIIQISSCVHRTHTQPPRTRYTFHICLQPIEGENAKGGFCHKYKLRFVSERISRVVWQKQKKKRERMSEPNEIACAWHSSPLPFRMNITEGDGFRKKSSFCIDIVVSTDSLQHWLCCVKTFHWMLAAVFIQQYLTHPSEKRMEECDVKNI